MNATKRLFHSFFSLFDKDSISKQDFDKLKQFDIFPKSFLVHFERIIFETKYKGNQDLKWENKKKEKEIQNLKLQNEYQKQEIMNLKSQIREKKESGMESDVIKNQIQTESESQNESESETEIEIDEKSNQNQNEFLKIFSDSEIIKDNQYIQKLKEWINDDEFFSKMKKGYSAKKDGFNCKKWHKIVDNKGKTLVIIKTKDNFIFGGFTQVGFTNDKSKWSFDGGDSGWIIDPNAFIFSLRNDKRDRKPKKFPIQKDRKEYAMFYDLDYGPFFGCSAPGDFALDSNLQPYGSNFGDSYNLPNGITYKSNEAYNYLAGSYKSWIVDELETYFI
ncbi:e3 ubiquitin-protein ligase [Anaeramoeba ignava]|uniref:E3 ubiquitin-protein ligase n=1 Tax=Anaeramoeba ignava TaxID=1746090 RepID=A0A9Q0LJ22_ANAIG|nr:e3 ubiquitin-protein ligase [Anaeramoeba ignava]